MDEEIKKARLSVEFLDLASTQFSFYVENVNPFQLFCVSKYLDYLANLELDKQRKEQEKNKIQVPTPKIIVRE